MWGIDLSEESLAAAAATAARAALPNVRFERVSASEVARRASAEAAPAAGEASPARGGGVVIYCALHACGGLADLTAAMAVAHRSDGRVAAFIACTCCFCSNVALRSDGVAGAVAGAAYAGAVCGSLAAGSPPPDGDGSGDAADDDCAGSVSDDGASGGSSVGVPMERAGGVGGGGGGGGGGGAWGLDKRDVGRLTRLAELCAAAVRAPAMHAVNALRLGALEMAARAPRPGGGGMHSCVGGRLEAAALLAMPEEYTPQNLVIRGIVGRVRGGA